MEIMTDVVELIKVVAWPLVIIVAIYILFPHKKRNPSWTPPVKAGQTVAVYTSDGICRGTGIVVQVCKDEIYLDHQIAGLRPGDFIKVV